MKSLLFISSFLVSQCFCFLLESTSSSYAQFRKWNVALNGSLEFEFKTDQPNGLLLYTDDGGTYDFFEIKLVEGALRLRYNLGGGAQIITIGRELNDGHWHKVSVKRNDNKTTLTLDDDSQSRTSKGKEFHFGNLATNSDVYVGGMPSWYNTKLTRLALPSVIFEPRFSGAIRNLVYTDSESNAPKRQRIKRSSKRRVVQGFDAKAGSTDICETEDPCQNGGICITTDNGPICDCHNLDFEGAFCEKDKAPSEATFYGKEYVQYNLKDAENEATSTTQETINFSFRTKYSNGFLFHSGNEEDYLNIIMKDGGISVLMKVTTGKLDMYIKPNKIRFDDYRWHRITLHRRIKEISAITSFCRVSLTVDGIYNEHASTAGTFTMLSSSKLYIGGSEHTRTLPGSSTNQNFVGCLRKMLYEIDGKKIDIFEVAKSGSKLVSIGGQLAFACRTSDASDAISFTAPDSFLVLPDWEAAQAGSFAIKFRTTEPHGLLVFSKAQGSSFSDVFAIELIEGQVYMIMDLGAGIVKEQVGIGKMNDGLWHSVLLHREGRNGRVAVDGFGIEFSLPGESRQLDLGIGLYIGGIPWQKFQNEKFPVSIWSAVLRRGFVGCVRELVLNEEPVDVVKYTEEQDVVSIEPVCHASGNSCASNPCFNQGECIDGWNRFICDCSRTEFNGPTCSKVSPIMYFNGTQNMLVKMPPNTKHQVEDVLIRFKTIRPVGLLFATTHKSGDTVEIGVFGGKIRLMVKINNREKAVVNGDQLNDNTWHTVRYLRYGAFVLIQVDNRRSIKVESVFTEYDIMNVNHIHIGGYVEVAEDDLPLIGARLPKFIGAMQRLTFNEVDYIEASKTSYLHEDDTTMPKVYSNAQYTKEENLQNLHRAFTILSKNTFVGLSPLKAFSSIHIYFQFKTKEPNGLLIYSGGKKSDYLAVELANGHIYAFFQMKSELIKIKDGAKSSFSDNRWHTVTIKQPTRKIYTLQVDDIIVAAMRRHDVDESLQLAGILYIGGVPNEIRAIDSKPLRSKYGFQGCLANIHLNEESPDLVEDALLPSTLIVSGCEGSGKRCNHNTCDNRGVCVQQWNSQICDCSMTSYTGPTCSDESIAYEFGPGRGLITYTFPEDRRPEMKTDVLALGFITDKDDAVLFRVDSGTSNDYLELEIVEGNIFMVYNMGTQDQPIGEIGTKVNDNTYHIIRFTRNGANSTLQLDDFNTQTIFPGGHQLSVFNNQATIQIGGKWNRVKQRIERPFGGIISGLVFNGLRILDLSHEKDRRTETRGEVTRVSMIKSRVISEPPMQYQQMQPTPTSDSPQVTDELIFSGAGSGCNYDDEDHCKVAVQVDKDDLITPVYVAPSHHPFTPVKPKIIDEGKQPCDDEDCVEGSGYEPEPGPEHPEISTETNISKYSATQTTEIDNDVNNSATLSQFTPRSNMTPVVTIVSVGMVPVPNDTSLGNILHLFNITNEVFKNLEHRFKKLQNSTISTVTEPYTTPSSFTTPATYMTSSITTPELNTTVIELKTTTASYVTTTKRYSRPPIDPSIKGRTHEANAAITIIIICAILIVIIVITILVLLFNRRTETNYKIESHKSFSNNQNQSERKPLSVLLPNESHSNMQSNLLTPPSNINNNLRMGNKVKKRQDVKEWYV